MPDANAAEAEAQDAEVDAAEAEAQDAGVDAAEAEAQDVAIVDAMPVDANSIDAAPTPACDDGTQNGSETDVDCGGRCTGCADTAGCVKPADCLSGVCTDAVCQSPRCGDGVINGSEACDDGNTVTEACAYGLAECTVCAADCTEQQRDQRVR